MFSSHYRFNWELAVLVTADRDDQQIKVPKVLSKIHTSMFFSCIYSLAYSSISIVLLL
jgi:hypothetical protein